MVDLKAMNLTTKRRLIQLACVAAWSDMKLADVERDVVISLATELGLEGGDLDLVRHWLAEGPPDFDPYDVPHEHRQAFLDAFIRVIEADGRIDPEESESVRLIRELVT